jgi:hypothetical protein
MNYTIYDTDHLKSMRFGMIHTLKNPTSKEMADYVYRELPKLEAEISKRLQLVLQFDERDEPEDGAYVD